MGGDEQIDIEQLKIGAAYSNDLWSPLLKYDRSWDWLMPVVQKCYKIDDEENIIVLRGGIKTDNGNFVAQAGDVVSSTIIKKLIKLFTIVSDNTIIMTIKKNINE